VASFRHGAGACRGLGALALLVVVVMVAACNKDIAPMDANPTPALARTALRSGPLSADVSVPAGWNASASPAGLDLTPHDAPQRRHAPHIALRLGPGAQLEGDWPQQRVVAGHTVRYRLVRADGGSGGEMVEFNAWRPCGQGHLLLQYTTQSEAPGTPDLEAAWAVLAGTVCTPGS
jgi:hypothetical protein